MNTEVDLFGQEILTEKRQPTKLKGYAAPPGTGPKGETCRTCEHYCRVRKANTYRKCGKVRDRWMGGPGTDILARSPACAYWEKAKP